MDVENSKRDNYVSSSDEDAESGDGDHSLLAEQSSVGPPTVYCNPPAAKGPKTGPKGVIRDYKHYKEMKEREEQWKQQQQKASSRKPPPRTGLVSTQADEDMLSELEWELESDPFLKEYREKRLRQMQAAVEQRQNRFGNLVDISSNTFLEVVEDENPSVYVIVHVYDNSVDACITMNGCLACLASDYTGTKFCSLPASDAHVSHQFKSDGLPALLVYKGGQLIGNFIRLSDQLGDDFYASDIENFLIYHNCLPKSDKI